MPRLWLAAVLLTVPLAGCLGGTDCGTSYEATWREPGLFDAVEDASGRGEVYTLDAGLVGGRPTWLPQGRLPFDATLGAVPAEEVDLLEVSRETGGTGRQADRASLRALASEDPERAELRLEVWGNRTEDELASLFGPLVENVTTVDDETRQAWFDRLLEDRRRGTEVVRPGASGAAAREVQYVYTVDVRSTWTTERVLDEHVAPDGELPRPSNGPGHATFSGATWSLSFWPDAWTARFPADGPSFVLEVDAFDRVELDRQDGLWEDEERTRTWVNQTFAEAGLPAPTFDGWRYDATVC